MFQLATNPIIKFGLAATPLFNNNNAPAKMASKSVKSTNQN